MLATTFVVFSLLSFSGLLTSGPMAESVPIPEVEARQEDNGLLMAACDCVRPIPWAGKGKYKVGEVLSEMHWMDGSIQEAGPRPIARKQIQRLHEHGFALKSAFEMEFVLEHADSGIDYYLQITDYADLSFSVIVTHYRPFPIF